MTRLLSNSSITGRRRGIHPRDCLKIAEDLVSPECIKLILDSEFYYPVPVMGVPSMKAYQGYMIPTIAGGGFSSLSDLVNEATVNGKKQEYWFNKVGALAVSAAASTLWQVGTNPPAGANTAIAAGVAEDNTATGSLKQSNAAGGDTLHVIGGWIFAQNAPNSLLLYDRIWAGGSIATAISTAQSITGVPTRYATTTSPGNFGFVAPTAGLGGTQTALTVTYMDQAGNTAEAAPVFTPTAAAVNQRIVHSNWFFPLNAGDTGLRKVTQVQFAGTTGTGTLELVIGHPLCWMPVPVANLMTPFDLIDTPFNLPQVLDGAALALLEYKGQASASTYIGSVTLASG